MELSKIQSKTTYKYGERNASVESRFKFLETVAGEIPIDPFETAENYMKCGDTMFYIALQHLRTQNYKDSYILFKRYHS